MRTCICIYICVQYNTIVYGVYLGHNYEIKVYTINNIYIHIAK